MLHQLIHMILTRAERKWAVSTSVELDIGATAATEEMCLKDYQILMTNKTNHCESQNRSVTPNHSMLKWF